MKQHLKSYIIFLLVHAIVLNSCSSSAQHFEDTRFVSHMVDLKTQSLKLYLKNSEGTNYSNFQNLKTHLETNNQKLVFAMNGGMSLKDSAPHGMFIQNRIIKTQLDTTKIAYGNFYLQPNGFFYRTKDKVGLVCETTDFKYNSNIAYTTQSEPMLVIDNKILPTFVKGSKNLHMRNGVGVLPNRNLLFTMSKDLIPMCNFAEFFKINGCQNALYLDGFVSRTFLPKKKHEQLDGDFGVIIAETELMN